MKIIERDKKKQALKCINASMNNSEQQPNKRDNITSAWREGGRRRRGERSVWGVVPSSVQPLFEARATGAVVSPRPVPPIRCMHPSLYLNGYIYAVRLASHKIPPRSPPDPKSHRASPQTLKAGGDAVTDKTTQGWGAVPPGGSD